MESFLSTLFIVLVGCGFVAFLFALSRVRREHDLLRQLDYDEKGFTPPRQFELWIFPESQKNQYPQSESDIMNILQGQDTNNAQNNTPREGKKTPLIRQFIGQPPHYTARRLYIIFCSIDPRRNTVTKIPPLIDLHNLTEQKEHSYLSTWFLTIIPPAVLIVGIAGTLWGIHHALGKEVGQLVSSLPEALRPGMWAVAATILLFIFRGLYQREWSKFTNDFDLFTIKKLVPFFSRKPPSKLSTLKERLADINHVYQNLVSSLQSLDDPSIRNNIESGCQTFKNLTIQLFKVNALIDNLNKTQTLYSEQHLQQTLLLKHIYTYIKNYSNSPTHFIEIQNQYNYYVQYLLQFFPLIAVSIINIPLIPQPEPNPVPLPFSPTVPTSPQNKQYVNIGKDTIFLLIILTSLVLFYLYLLFILP